MKKLSLKRLLKKRNNGGFTLLEVIISCALLSILVLGVMGFVGPVMQMVRLNEKNARATMLAETINTYINGCLKNAYAVEVFTYSDKSNVSTPEDVNNTLRKEGKGLTNIDAFMKSQGADETNYEIRCLGITWEYDKTAMSGKSKLMLTNCSINTAKVSSGGGEKYSLELKTPPFKPGTPQPSPQIRVFDDALYDGLYPVVNVTNYSSEKDEDGNYIKEKQTNGYRVETNVYTDQDCYNILEAERNKSHLGFTGVSYVKCVNMKGAASDIYLCETDLQHAIDNNSSSTLRYTSGDGTYFYPSTYIYYVVSKK